ncbi:hypothetical protein [Spirosoma panaciterrae]|uniref:hypothetical protein n=1 Tax=Spirosoma panaciterrae TaxID=496058 RepID=UPI000360FE90|nr:hypothetical protein [Spirosoma panaciterrae]
MKIFTGCTYVLAVLLSSSVYGQQQPDSPTLDIGVRLQKSISLYAENGLMVQYAHPKLASNRLYLGLAYVSSRLGSAFHSNAIKQDSYLFSASYYYRPKWLIHPVLKANIGYFAAHYGSPIFEELPKTSLLLAPEVGLCYCPTIPLKIHTSIGYHLINGNGRSGPGTLYPVFLQTSITWNVLKRLKK